MANNVDTDQEQSDLSLHCWPRPVLGFSLVSALGHGPKNNPDVHGIDDQAGHFV